MTNIREFSAKRYFVTNLINLLSRKIIPASVTGLGFYFNVNKGAIDWHPLFIMTNREHNNGSIKYKHDPHAIGNTDKTIQKAGVIGEENGAAKKGR